MELKYTFVLILLTWFKFALNCFVQVVKCLHKIDFWLWLLRWTMLALKNSHSSGKKYQKPRSWNTGMLLCSLINHIIKYLKKFVQSVDFSACRPVHSQACDSGLADLWPWWFGSLYCHRLRCHVMESIKPTVSPIRNSSPDKGTSEQQELNTGVSSSEGGAFAPLGDLFFYFYFFCAVTI